MQIYIKSIKDEKSWAGPGLGEADDIEMEILTVDDKGEENTLYIHTNSMFGMYAVSKYSFEEIDKGVEDEEINLEEYENLAEAAESEYINCFVYADKFLEDSATDLSVEAQYDKNRYALENVKLDGFLLCGDITYSIEADLIKNGKEFKAKIIKSEESIAPNDYSVCDNDGELVFGEEDLSCCDKYSEFLLPMLRMERLLDEYIEKTDTSEFKEIEDVDWYN